MSCGDWPTPYIGQAGRKLQTRLNERVSDAKKAPAKSAFAVQLKAIGPPPIKKKLQKKKVRWLTALNTLRAVHSPNIIVINEVIPYSYLAVES